MFIFKSSKAIAFVLLVSVFILQTGPAYAAPRTNPFTIGQTIDPGAEAIEPCGPTDGNCFTAVLSTQDEGTTISNNVLRFNFVGAGVSATSTAGVVTVNIAGGGLTALSNGKIYIGDASNIPTEQTLTGDATLSNVGLLTISPNAVALGTDTTGNYVSDLTSGLGIVVTGTAGEGWSPVVSLDINGLTTAPSVDNADELAIFDVSAGAVRKITRANFLSGITGALVYQGSWDPSINTPILADGVGTQGQYCVAATSSSINLGSGSLTFTTGDWVIYNGSVWEKLDSANDVQSVFGRVGIITASAGDYNATQITNVATGTILSTNVQAAINELDTEKLSISLVNGGVFIGNVSGVATPQFISGDATLSNTGVLSIPDATALVRGLVSTSSQTFAGNKTFNNDVTVFGNTSLATATIATATIGALNINTIAVPNVTAQDIVATRTLTAATTTLATTTISNLTASVFSAITGAISNFLFGNATGTNIIATGTLASTNQFNANLVNVSGTSTLATTTATSFFASLANIVTATINSLTGGTITATSSLVSQGTLAVTGTSTLATTTVSNLIANALSVNSLVLPGTLAVTGTSTFSTTTTASSTITTALNVLGSLFGNIASFVTATITNLTATNAVFTNATSTNATSTNLFTTNARIGTSTVIGNETVGGTLGVTGATSLSSTLNVTGTSTLATTTVTRITALEAIISNLTATVADLTSLVFNNATGTNLVAGNINATSSLTAATTTIGATSVGGTLSVLGTSTLATTTASGLTLTQNGLTLASSTPATSTNVLYNIGGTLYFNGVAVGTGISTSSPFTLNPNGTITNSSSTAVLVFGNQLTLATTSNALYNQNGTLFFNGTALGGGVRASYMLAVATTTQTANLANGNHVFNMEVDSQFGSDISLDTTSAYTSTNNVASRGRFTLKAGRTYKLTGNVICSSSGCYLGYGWFNADTGVEIGSGGSAGEPQATAYGLSDMQAVAVFTPATDTRVELRFKNSNGSFTGVYANSSFAKTHAFIEVIAGNSAVTGQSVDYISVIRTSAQSVSAGNPVLFNVITEGNIPYNTSTGLFSLKAGKTYRLAAAVQINATSEYQWRTAANVALNTSEGAGATGVTSGQELIYTPSVDTDVKYVVVTGGTTVVNRGFATIQQLGSSATTEYTNNVLGNFASGGAIFGTAMSEYINHVQITQTTTAQTLSIPNPSNTSLSRIVYIDNIGTANFQMHGVTVGAGETAAFKWNGTTWKSFGNQANNVAAEYGENNGIGDAQTTTSTSYTDVTGGSFTLPSAGTWEVDYITFVKNTVSGNTIKFVLTDSSNSIVPNSQGAYEQVTGVDVIAPTTQKVFITTTGSATYKLRWLVSGGTGNIYNNGNLAALDSGHSKITWKKIGGYIPVVGQTVDYLRMSKTANQPITTAPTIITFASATGNITNNPATGQITLTAGKTYELMAGVTSVNGSSARPIFSWFNVTSGTAIGDQMGLYSPSDVAANSGGGGIAHAIITPIVTTIVDFRLVGGAGGGAAIVANGGDFNAGAGESAWATVKQLGSTASTGVAFNSLTNAIAAGSLDNTNFAQTWNWSTATSTTGLSMIADVLTTGGLVSLTSSSTSLNSTNGLLYVANTSTATSGILARFQSNSTAGSGLTVYTNGIAGIGTTGGTNWSTARQALMLGNTSAIAGGTGLAYLSNNWYFDGTNDRRITPAPVTRLEQITGGYRFQTAATGTANSVIASFTTSFEIENGGFINVNTTSGATNIPGVSQAQLQLTAAGGRDGINVRGTGTNNLFNLYTPTTANTTMIGFRNDQGGAGSQNGSIQLNGNTTSYNTTSDERLKTDTGLRAKGLADLLTLTVRKYSWNNSGDVQDGFFAQELANIVPIAVSVGNDEVDVNGDLVNPWSVDYGKLTPILTQAVQDLHGLVFATTTASGTPAISVINSIEDVKNLLGTSTLMRDGVPQENIVSALQSLMSSTSSTSTLVSLTDVNGNTTEVTQDTFVGSVWKAMKERMIAWFEDMENGITKFFAKEVKTQKLCVADESGAETCLTKSQIDSMLQGANNGNSTSGTQGGGGNSDSANGSSTGDTGDTNENDDPAGDTIPDNAPTTIDEPTPVLPEEAVPVIVPETSVSLITE